VTGSTFVAQKESATCCSGLDCPLRTVNVAAGLPGCSFSHTASSDFRQPSYELDTDSERVISEQDDTEDEMSITRADLYPDSYGRGSNMEASGSGWRSTDVNNGAVYSQGLRERPSRAIRRPARYEDYETQYAPTQSQRIRSVRYVRSITSYGRCSDTYWVTRT